VLEFQSRGQLNQQGTKLVVQKAGLLNERSQGLGVTIQRTVMGDRLRHLNGELESDRYRVIPSLPSGSPVWAVKRGVDFATLQYLRVAL
jgi:hypothetical protein